MHTTFQNIKVSQFIKQLLSLKEDWNCQLQYERNFQLQYEQGWKPDTRCDLICTESSKCFEREKPWHGKKVISSGVTVIPSSENKKLQNNFYLSLILSNFYSSNSQTGYVEFIIINVLYYNPTKNKFCIICIVIDSDGGLGIKDQKILGSTLRKDS